MKICVCAKQVPDTNEVRIDPVKGTLIREGVPSILNPDDANALEAALQLKDEYKDTTISVISMGPPQATYMLRECLAMGADEAVLLSDRAFGGADTCATSTTIAAGIKMLGDVDIIFGGRQAIDGDTAQVGPQVAMRLGIPVVTYVQKIVEYTGDKIKVQRQLEDGYEVIEVKLPCFLTCVKELNEPRYMSVGAIVDAYKNKQFTIIPNLFILSNHCNIVNGVHLYRLHQKHKIEFKDIPHIITSTNKMFHVDGDYLFIGKPFDNEFMLKQIEKVLN